MTYRSYNRRYNGDEHRRNGTSPIRRVGGTFDRRAPLPALPPLSGDLVAQRLITDGLDELLAALPPRVANPLRNMADLESLLEVVLDLGRPPEARFPGREVQLDERDVDQSDLTHVVTNIGEFGG